MDGYNNDAGGGFVPELKSSDSVTFLQQLAEYAHSPKNLMGIGLKNAGDIVGATVQNSEGPQKALDWVVNEQCVQLSECDTFSPYIGAGKPVFHIEYQVDKFAPAGQPPKTPHEDCTDPTASQFSTIIKADSQHIPADNTLWCPQ